MDPPLRMSGQDMFSNFHSAAILYNNLYALFQSAGNMEEIDQKGHIPVRCPEIT